MVARRAALCIALVALCLGEKKKRTPLTRGTLVLTGTNLLSIHPLVKLLVYDTATWIRMER